MSLYAELVDALENDPPESAQEVLLNAAFLFEKAMLSATAQDPEDFARSMGWPPEVIEQETSEAGAHQLREALTRFIHRWMAHPSAGLAVWALSKLRDPGLKPLFDEVLEHHLERDPSILFQALVALQNVGIRLPGAEQGLSVNEAERNRVLARSYRLQRGASPEALAENSAPVESILRLLQELVRTPSRGGLDGYGSAISLVRLWLDGQGISSDVLLDEHGQPVALHASIGQGAPCFVLNAPLDTASYGDETRWTHPPASGLLQDGWLHGRGSGDSKSAVAIFCHIAAALRRRRWSGQGSVELLFDADEHTGRLGGMRAWLARRPEGVAGVFIGYPGDERIMIGSRGFWRARLRVYGEPGHSGAGRRKAANAISKAALLVRELEESPLPQRMREDFPLPPKLTVTGVRGGGDFALVPDVAIVEVDLRLTPAFEASAAEALVREAVRKTEEAWPSPRPTEVEVLPGWPAYVLTSGAPLVRALQTAAQQVRG
jgi:succinyl-diaminopimelate desuccinylase